MEVGVRMTVAVARQTTIDWLPLRAKKTTHNYLIALLLFCRSLDEKNEKHTVTICEMMSPVIRRNIHHMRCVQSDGGFVLWHKRTELAYSFLFRSCVYFCLYGPFNCILFRKFSRQVFVFSLCSSSLISALLVFSSIYLLMKVSFSPDIIPSRWLGSKHQLTN